MTATDDGGNRTPTQSILQPTSGSLLRGRSWLVDLLVALAVFLYTLPILPGQVPPSDQASWRLAVLVGLAAVICGAHLIRRRHPVLALGVMVVAATAQLAVSPQAGLIAADVMLALAVYNLATRFRWQVSVFGAGVVALWLLAAVQGLLRDRALDLGEAGLLLVVIGWAWTWGALVRARREHIAGLRERAEQLERERDALARVAVVEERARIAREIHDIVSHGLSVVVVLAEGAATRVRTDPEQAGKAMLTVRDTGRSALADMRRMLDVLRADEPGSHAPQPGVAQLPELVARSVAAGLPATLTIVGTSMALAAGLELTVYRIVQESLTNVGKHAGPALTRVQVQLHYGANELTVRVCDDGSGPGRDVRTGHGLAGMRERVAAHGGRLTTGGRPRGGFEVAATLPTKEVES